jgi:hypothetical protein
MSSTEHLTSWRVVFQTDWRKLKRDEKGAGCEKDQRAEIDRAETGWSVKRWKASSEMEAEGSQLMMR